MKPYVVGIVGLVFLATSLSASAAERPEEVCKPLHGAVTLKPDVDCNIKREYQDSNDPAPLLFLDTCFSVELVGSVRGTGYAGLTSETLVPPVGMLTFPGTPAVLPLEGLPQGQLRQVFTARTILYLQGGEIYTADAGVQVFVVEDGDIVSSTEQIVIVKGTGDYEGARGTLSVVGNPVGDRAVVQGEVCTPVP